jgi:pimeloyl-ACP methyl ester carboxylesterase
MQRHDGSLTVGWHVFGIDGLTQAYEVAGSGPVCVVHSGGPGINSDYLRMPLLEEHLTMVYLDPIGTGRSSLLPGGQYTVATYAHYLNAVLDHVGEPQPVILGHSHGGMVVLELATHNPDRVGGLIAYDTAPILSDELWQESVRQIAAFPERWPDRPEAVQAARRWMADPGGLRCRDGDAFEAFLSEVLPAYFADYRRVLDSEHPLTLTTTWDPARVGDTWTAVPLLGAIDTPTLIICGDYDFVCSPRWSKQMHATIPHAELLELHDSGHFGHLEQPEEFVASVLTFIQARH